MEQKKPKTIKLRDLKPTKDAKGGHGHGGGGYGIGRVQLGMVVRKSHRSSIPRCDRLLAVLCLLSKRRQLARHHVAG
jgi:hypothetical protein